MFSKKKISWTDDSEEEVEVQMETPPPQDGNTAAEPPAKSKAVPGLSDPRTLIIAQERKISTIEERLNRLPVNERFALMSDSASSVIEGTIKSIIIGGDPGLGKTHEVVENLLKKKYKRVENEDYILIKAGVSAFGVYKFVVLMAERAETAHALRAEKEKENIERVKRNLKPLPIKVKIPVIVFDDVPLWKGEPRLLELVKGLTDTSDRRIVSWLTDRAELDPEKAKKLGKLPAQVEYTGGVIIITNEDRKVMNDAIVDRSIWLPIEVSEMEMAERMRTLLAKIMPHMDNKLKKQVLNWLLSNEYEGKERSMRTLVKALQLANANPNNWLRMVQIV